MMTLNKKNKISFRLITGNYFLILLAISVPKCCSRHKARHKQYQFEFNFCISSKIPYLFRNVFFLLFVSSLKGIFVTFLLCCRQHVSKFGLSKVHAQWYGTCYKIGKYPFIPRGVSRLTTNRGDTCHPNICWKCGKNIVVPHQLFFRKKVQS